MERISDKFKRMNEVMELAMEFEELVKFKYFQYHQIIELKSLE